MSSKQNLIDTILRSNIAYAEKVELIQVIQNSKDDNDSIVKSIIRYFNIGEKAISLFYDSPADILEDLQEFIEKLSNF